MYIKGYNLT